MKKNRAQTMTALLTLAAAYGSYSDGLRFNTNDKRFSTKRALKKIEKASAENDKAAIVAAKRKRALKKKLLKKQQRKSRVNSSK
jgi:hypothetical protein